MRHILHKGRLLFVGLFHQKRSLFQFLVILTGFVTSLTHIFYIASERLQHRDIAILQTSHLIDAGKTFDVEIHITLGYLLRLLQQTTEWTQRAGHHLMTIEDNQEQSYDKKRHSNIGKPVIVCEDIALRTYDSKAPCSARNRFVANQRGSIIDDHRHTPLSTPCHLVTQGNQVCLFLRIGHTEDGLVEETGRIRVSHVSSLLVKHDKVRMRIRLLLCQNL